MSAAVPVWLPLVQVVPGWWRWCHHWVEYGAREETCRGNNGAVDKRTGHRGEPQGGNERRDGEKRLNEEEWDLHCQVRINDGSLLIFIRTWPQNPGQEQLPGIHPETIRRCLWEKGNLISLTTFSSFMWMFRFTSFYSLTNYTCNIIGWFTINSLSIYGLQSAPQCYDFFEIIHPIFENRLLFSPVIMNVPYPDQHTIPQNPGPFTRSFRIA